MSFINFALVALQHSHLKKKKTFLSSNTRLTKHFLQRFWVVEPVKVVQHFLHQTLHMLISDGGFFYKIVFLYYINNNLKKKIFFCMQKRERNPDKSNYNTKRGVVTPSKSSRRRLTNAHLYYSFVQPIALAISMPIDTIINPALKKKMR